MRNWGNSLADASADVSAFTPIEGKGYDSYDSVFYTDTGMAIPANLKAVLDFRPIRTTLTITIDAVPASLVEWEVAPSGAGVVAVNYLTGELAFHASDLGKTVAGSYKHLGTVVDQHLFNKLQQALSGAVTDISSKQDADDDLTALAGLATAGIISRTGAGTAAVRTITAVGTDVVITDGDGVAGNPLIGLSSNVPRLDALNTFSVNQTFSANILTSGTSSKIGIGNTPSHRLVVGDDLGTLSFEAGAHITVIGKSTSTGGQMRSGLAIGNASNQNLQFIWNGLTQTAAIGTWGYLAPIEFSASNIKFNTTPSSKSCEFGNSTTSIGFFGATPITQQSVTEFGADTDKLNEIMYALQNYGLIALV